MTVEETPGTTSQRVIKVAYKKKAHPPVRAVMASTTSTETAREGRGVSEMQATLILALPWKTLKRYEKRFRPFRGNPSVQVPAYQEHSVEKIRTKVPNVDNLLGIRTALWMTSQATSALPRLEKRMNLSWINS
jgi:hypothetical protein